MKIIYFKSRIKKPALFLDRDGVINRDKPGKYITSLNDIKIYKTAIEGLKKLQNKYHLIIITNQSAIGRGYITEREFIEINNSMIEELKKNDIIIEAVYYCPHRPENNCKCRKPQTTLIEEAIKDYKIDLKNSFVIGDKISDIEMAKRISVKSILVLTGQGKYEIKKVSSIKPDYVINNLREIYKIL